MESLNVYLPKDRYQTLLRGEGLPERSNGVVLFADISGFTPLTETLARMLGPRRGAEELTLQLNRVYDTLIETVHRFGGSVIHFSGDAITCWFDVREGGRQNNHHGSRADAALASDAPLLPVIVIRAMSCAMALLRAMDSIGRIDQPDGSCTTLALKVAVASGPARRFLVGDPAIQIIDVLAGATVTRMAAAAELARKGEALVDMPTFRHLDGRVEVAEWRRDEESGERFAVVTASHLPLDESPASVPTAARPRSELPPDTLRPWLLPAIYDRLVGGQGELLTELRPATALFLRFGGIDYEGDADAGRKLDSYIRQVQSILARYESFLLQLTIGDKGNYLYAAFGAPVAHEDDARRAVRAAIELRALSASHDGVGLVQIGISQGMMRTGAYGSSTRRTYGVMGDEVNLAARLMSNAAPGQVLVSGRVRRAMAEAFVWEDLPPLLVKGKTEPVPIAGLLRERARHSVHRLEPALALPMIGREQELAFITDQIDEILAGSGKIIGITAEAGMGKSRLVSEVIRLATARGFMCYSGECQSYGTNSAYLAWHPIWRAFFELPPDASLEAQIVALTVALTQIDPGLLPRLPLLGPALDLSIPESDLSGSLSAQVRKVSRESLLVDCLRARAAATPIMLVLEDIHWLDPLSHDLLEVLGRAIVHLPVLIVLAYRPPELLRLQVPRVMGLPHATTIQLDELTPAEVELLIQSKLVQHGALSGYDETVPPALAKRVAAHAQGNPFYIEELLNYLHSQGLDLHDQATWASIELPTSLHSLILSRLDQLNEPQQITLKVASVIGRLFRVAWLCGYYPTLGAQEKVMTELEELSRQELTLREPSEAPLTYLFKHVVTQAVAYESLAYATRASLHEQFACYLEATAEPELGQALDLLVYHYTRSTNLDKKREYLRRAGEAAHASYANDAALEYYEQLLPLLTDPSERIELLLRLESLLVRVGRWNDAVTRARQALDLAQTGMDQLTQARCAQSFGVVLAQQGEADTALKYLEQARETGDTSVQIAALIGMGQLASDHGDFTRATAYLEAALWLTPDIDDVSVASDILSKLSWVAFMRGAFSEMRNLATAALAQGRAVGCMIVQALALRRLGIAELSLNNYAEATRATEEGLALYRKIGDREGIAACMHNLGQIYRHQRDYDLAIRYCDEGLSLYCELGSKRNIAMCLFTRGLIAIMQHDPAFASRCYNHGLELARGVGDRWVIAGCLQGLGLVAVAEGDAHTAATYYHAALDEATAIGVQSITLWALIGFAQLYILDGQLEKAAEIVGMAYAHPAGGSDARFLGEPVLEHLRTQLPAATLEEALARGQTRELAATVAAIRHDYS